MENFAFLNQERILRSVIFHSVLRLQLNFVGSPGISFHGNLAGKQYKFVTSANCFYFDQGKTQVKFKLIGERFVNWEKPPGGLLPYMGQIGMCGPKG